MNNQPTYDPEKMRELFCLQAGAEFQALMEPISEALPSGESLKSNGVYSAIKSARRSDDPNLPMGEWKHDLKIADWDQVSKIALEALLDKTKDLQIAIWLLEAQLHLHGFAGLAPSIQFLTELTENFWQDIYPQIEDNDLEYRTNLIAWLDKRLHPVISQIPITETKSDHQYCWADWEMAIKVETLSEDNKKGPVEHVPTKSILLAITATPIEFYQKLYQDCSNAISSIDQLSSLLDKLCGNDAPSLASLKTLLLEIRETLTNHVKQRGLFLQSNSDIDNDTTSKSEKNASSNGGNGDGNHKVNNREKAYAQLAEAAEFLMQDDPHSPSPYLVLKAIEWGNLNTAELYQQLFVEYQGQLNIFEMLGLEINPQ